MTAMTRVGTSFVLGDVINSFLEWPKNGENSKIVRKIPKLCEKFQNCVKKLKKHGLKWLKMP